MVALANGAEGVDAAVAGAYAAANDTGVLLTRAGEVPAVTAKALRNFQYVKAFGGPTMIADSIISALQDR